MRGAYVIHIVCGSLGLLSGFVALYTAKGGGVHRKSGRLFVYVMLVMALAGLTLAVVLGTAPELNVPAAVLTSYLVVTALTTVRPPAAGARLLHLAAMVVGLIVGLTALTLGFEAVANGGKRNGLPAFPFFMFGVVGLLGAIGDLRVWRQGARRGTARLARHLWRMSFALFIAALSFFIGQAKVFPRTDPDPPAARAAGPAGAADHVLLALAGADPAESPRHGRGPCARSPMSRLLPERIDNHYRGHVLALWLFVPVAVQRVALGLTHLLRADGGAQSISTIPLDSYPSSAAQNVIGLFARMGLEQLLFGSICLLVLLRYRALIPLMYLLIVAHYLASRLVGQVKPLVLAGSSGARTPMLVIAILCALGLVLSLSGRGYREIPPT